MPVTERTRLSLVSALLLAAGLTLAGSPLACTSAEPPPPEPAVEEEPAAPAPTTPAPPPVSPEQAEIEAERRMEEAMERVPVAEPMPADQEQSVLELMFDHGTATLTEVARAELDRMYEELIAGAKDFFLDVQGHTDPTGSEGANQILAEQRAEVVRDYLHRQKGVPLERMGVTALGSTVPVAHNHTPDGREQNRRVVVVVLLPP